MATAFQTWSASYCKQRVMLFNSSLIVRQVGEASPQVHAIERVLIEMKTKRQEALISSFLSMLEDETRLLYQEIIMYLSELGYNPQKQRSFIVFKHDLHNKQMAKIGIKNKEQLPFFALRFSACRGYSQKLIDIVSMAVSKDNLREAACLNNGCNYCSGEAVTRVYTYTFPDGESKSHCGAVALEIPNITADDISEIKRLIKEEHEYLLKHEAGAPTI